MKKSNAVKGVLLSGLVFPGAGQMALKHRIRGMGFILATFAGLICLAVPVFQTVQAVLAQITTAQGADELEQLVKIMELIGNGLASPLLLWGIAVLSLVWIVSSVDAYLLGQKMDKANEKETVQPDLG